MAYWVVSGTDSAATDSDQVKTIAANSKSITAATKAANCQLTITGHGMNAGEYIYVTSVGGMTQLNSLYHQIASVVDANNITLSTDSTSYGTYTSGGTAVVEGTSLQNPCNVRSVGHNISVGDVVVITGVAGTTQLNNNAYTVSAILSVDSFSINVNATAFSRYSSGGSATLYYRAITGATQANPCQITVAGHGRATGSRVYIENVGGMTQLNGKTFTLTSTGTNTFTLDGVDSTAFSAYTSGGTITWVRDTIQNAINRAANADTILVEKTTAASSIAGGVTFTWTRGSTSVGTSSTTVGTINVGDIIGPTTASMNGSTTTGYRVTAVGASAVTIENRFWHSDSVGTIVEAGCLRFNPVNEGGSGAAIISNSKSITVEGGYTFANNTAPVRDSYSLYKHAFGEANSAHLGLSASAGTFRYISFADCYINYRIFGTTVDISYATSISPGVYPFEFQSTPTTPPSNLMSFSASSSYAAYTCSAAVEFANTCYGFSAAAANATAFLAQSTYIIGGRARVSNVGYNPSVSGSRIENGDSQFTADRHYSTGSSVHGLSLINCTSNYASGGGVGGYGVLTGTTTSNLLIKDCTFNNASYGVYCQQVDTVIIENASYTNNTVDVYVDQYCAEVRSYKSAHTTPGTACYQRATGRGGAIIIVGDTVDNASRHKLFSYPIYSNLQNKRPYFALQNAFGFTGAIYPYAQIIRNFGASPYTEFTWSTVPTDSYPFFILKTPVRTGVGVDIDYSLSVQSSLAANITPVVYLNGVEIQSETAISSFSTYPTWTDYTVTVTGGTITEDGLLELGFKINSGTGTLRFKCNDVT